MKSLSTKFLARIKWRYDQYYENKKKQTQRDNAMKMAHNWTHEYRNGTPMEFIRDDILACWERQDAREQAEAKKVIHQFDDAAKPEPMAALKKDK